jgi:hypothetical protein
MPVSELSKRLGSTMIFALILLVAIIPSSSQPIKVEEISKYSMEVTVTDSAHVRNEITLRNLIDKPLVPGIGEIRLQKVHPVKLFIFYIPFTEEREPVEVSEVKAYSGKTIINTRVEQNSEYTSIYYEIWHPIEPGKEYTFTIEFDADIVEKGLLFKTIKIPVGSDVDIRDLKIDVYSDWKLTYAEPKMDGSWSAAIPANHIAFFTAEFSILPLPELPVQGYILFWTLVIVLMVLVAIPIWRKR